MSLRDCDFGRVVVICGLLFGAPRVVAEAPLAEAGFLDGLPVVLTASRLPPPHNEVPAAVTVLDREMIRATGYQDVARLLRLVPGMQVGQERGNTHWVTYHGMGNDNPSWMQVLVDGRSVFSPGNFDGVDWAALALNIDEIERIEILRGTHSAAYGANAVLGAVNIVTRHSADQTGDFVQVAAGQRGNRGLSAEVSRSVGDADFRLSASSQGDAGFDRLHDARRIGKAALRGDLRLDAENELMLRLGGSSGWRELGYPGTLANNNGERQAELSSLNLHGQWRYAPDAGEEWMFHYYRNQDRVTEAWLASLGPYQDVPLDRNRRSTRDSVEVQQRRQWNDAWRTGWGGELRRDAVEAPFLYYGQPEQISRLARLFGTADWRATTDWTLNASVQGEKTTDADARVSPRLFANWRATEQETWRAGYARAWRLPFIFERRGDVRAMFGGTTLARPYVPNPDLEPARVDSVEMGYLHDCRGCGVRLDVRVFHERISGFIWREVTTVSPPPALAAFGLSSARYVNATVPVSLSGVEYQIDARPWDGARLLFSHALIHRRSDSNALEDLAAPYVASLSWMQGWGSGWSSTLTALHMGPIAGGSGFVANQTYRSAPYTTWDARVAKATSWWGRAIELSLVGTNLGGRHQEIADRAMQAQYPGAPVNPTSPMVWAALRVQLP